MESDLLYCRRRQVEETAAAASARDPKVGAVHRELARKYDERSKQLETSSAQVAILVSAA